MKPNLIISIIELNEIVGFILLGLLLVVLREGFKRRSEVDPKNGAWSHTWHVFGWGIRGCFIAILGILLKHTDVMWLFVVLAIILAWPVYDIACAIGAGRKWYYRSDKGMDKVIRKIFWFVNFDKQ